MSSVIFICLSDMNDAKKADQGTKTMLSTYWGFTKYSEIIEKREIKCMCSSICSAGERCLVWRGLGIKYVP